MSPGGETEISLPKNGAVISQKAAEMLGIGEGSIVSTDREEASEGSSSSTNTAANTAENSESSADIQIKTGAVFENYLQHYMIMSPEYYESVFGEKAVANQLFMIQTDTAEANQSRFGEMVTGLEGVASIGFLCDMQENLNDTIGTLDLIVWVILVSAGLLAFVVLYTLTTININERMREIATIKVLGFFDREVNSYIFRESYILTFIGILLGLAGGIVLHQYIIQEAAVEQLMYYKQVMPMSFLYSGLLTFVFSFVVGRLLQKKMRNINMVEALKSVE
jgi:putative ABC transport system permease protein